jgi:hypothetical protein
MTKSNKHKNERKKDFQKEKLKVGKARPKNTNATDTSFAAKCMQQYLAQMFYGYTNDQQQSYSNNKVSPKPVVKLAHSSTTTFHSSTVKTTISAKMLSHSSHTPLPRRQHLGHNPRL